MDRTNFKRGFRVFLAYEPQMSMSVCKVRGFCVVAVQLCKFKRISMSTIIQINQMFFAKYKFIEFLKIVI